MLLLLISQLAFANSLDIAFDNAAAITNIDVKLLRAVCWVESRHRTPPPKPDGRDLSVSHGVCQVKLRTARFLDTLYDRPQVSIVSLRNPSINILYAAQYLAWQLNRYNGNVEKALTAYNRGSYKKSMRLYNKYVINVKFALRENR
jgi:soluble lytic murein transglycosylase-like protein